MTETTQELTRVVEPEVVRMKPWERILNLFIAPTALMKNIKVYPAVLVPLILCIVISAASLPLTMRFTEIYTQTLTNLSIERYGVDYFNMAPAYDEDGTIAQTTDMITQISAAGSAVIAYPISAFFSALGLFILTKLSRKSSVKLMQYFSMFMHLSIITALGALITVSLNILLDTTLDITSLAAVFMPLGNITMPPFNVLTSITVFNVWTLVLAIIGIKTINNFSTVKAVVVGLIGYVISVGITAVSLSTTFLMMDLLSSFSLQ